MKKVKVLVVPTEVYSRVVGYYRPINDWHAGKRDEFESRRMLKETGGEFFNSPEEDIGGENVC